jgi:hypothetical protein
MPVPTDRMSASDDSLRHLGVPGKLRRLAIAPIATIQRNSIIINEKIDKRFEIRSLLRQFIPSWAMGLD